MSHSSLILPYVDEDANRKKPFTYNMEVATILCLAEVKRKKPGILDTSPEKISFISKLHYPLWAVPWENDCLIVDGLGIFSHTFVYMKPPDITFFTEDIKKSTTVRKLYRSALQKHAQTFKDFIETTKIPIDAIISDKGLLSTISQYLKQSSISKRDNLELTVLASPKISERAAVEAAEKIVNHLELVLSEIKGLQYAISVLKEENKFQEQKILREIEYIQETHEERILSIKPLVEKKADQLMKEFEAKIEKMIKATERDLKSALKEKDKEERKLRKLERSRRGFEEKRDARKRRGDKPGESYWNSEVRRCKMKMSKTKERIQSLRQRIEYVRKLNETTIKKLHEDYQTMIDEERKKITDLETSCYHEIATKRKEIEELQSEASLIINLVGQLIERKKLQVSELKEVSITWRPEEVTLICVPFYLIRYEIEAKSRHYLYTPVIATSHEGIIKRIQKAIWSFSLEYRIKLLLRPRSEVLRKMFTTVFAKKLKEDKALREILERLGSSNNLLDIPNFKDASMKGMEELVKEGWINQEEKNIILDSYMLYSLS